MKKTLAVLAIVVGAALAMQLIRPERSNPGFDERKSFDAAAGADGEVLSLIRSACYDCHSHETRWPWYSHVAPVMWLVAIDVKRGRSELNFSEWGTLSADRRDILLYDIREEISSGDMPPGTYVLLHAEAKLTEADKETVLDWIEKERERLPD
jgi:hypothetical protein